LAQENAEPLSTENAANPQAPGSRPQADPSAAIQGQSGQEDFGIREIVVTATKRPESAQRVPISIQAIDSKALEQLNISSFDDYLKHLPSVTSQSVGPGNTQMVMRGVSAQSIRQIFGASTNVATYFDDQPVTSPLGTLDVHIYDIERLEVLPGPQGTLYGAGSEGGTLRIITNKPDPKAFSAGFDLEGNLVSHGSTGYKAEGFANLPLSERAALRVVAWRKESNGWIDNVPSTRRFPSSGTCMSNFDPPSPGCAVTSNRAKKDFNDSSVTGGRAALKIDLDENWTVTPSVMAQQTRYDGVFGFDPKLGDLKVAQFLEDRYEDKWYDATLAIEGKISDFDVVFTNSYLNRDAHRIADYSDYAVAYDAYVGPFLKNDQGAVINPSQLSNDTQRFENHSHELRISSPMLADKFRFVAGAFYQQGSQKLVQDFTIDGLATALSVRGRPGTWWLNNYNVKGRNAAAFGEIYVDVLPKVTITGGLRYFTYRSATRGYIGPGLILANTFGYRTGEATCFGPAVTDAPCLNHDIKTTLSGTVPKIAISYQIDPDRMIYATWSKGYKPGGPNATADPFRPEYLTNHEFGWKTSWFDRRVQFNGAIFQQNWDGFQFGSITAGGISVTANAGDARIRGIETTLLVAPIPGLDLSASAMFLDGKLTSNYCGRLDANGDPITDCPNPPAPAGARLPNAPKFKGNLGARYEWSVGPWTAHVRGNLVHQSSSGPSLTTIDRDFVGHLPAYTMVDLAGGIQNDSSSFEFFVSNAFDKRAQLTRFTQCLAFFCAPVATYVLPSQPRTIGLRYGRRF